MGDRANVVVKDGDSTVWLYTHNEGSDLPGVLRESLQRGKERWHDGPYLARIIFDDMTRGDQELTGFGISSVPGDGDNRILLVNVDTQTVTITRHVEGSATWPGKPVSFDEYVNKPRCWPGGR